MAQILERLKGVEVTLDNQTEDLTEIKDVQKEILADVRMLLIHKAARDSEMRTFKRMAVAIAAITTGALNVAVLFIKAWWGSKA